MPAARRRGRARSTSTRSSGDGVMTTMRTIFVAALLPALLAAPAMGADDPTAPISELDQRALQAYDDLDFEKARSLLQQALRAVDAAELGKNPVAARTHLYLGMVLLGGFAQRDAAVEQFKAALAIQPDVAPPRGRFNP